MRSKAAVLSTFLTLLMLTTAARADTIDNFILTGNGHTITWSAPTFRTVPWGFALVGFNNGGLGSVDGVPGYFVGAFFPIDYSVGGGADVVLSVNPSIPDIPAQLFLYGPPLFTYYSETIPNPAPGELLHILYASFIPGTYDLSSGFTPPPPGSTEPGPPVKYTLTIITPEPPSLALFGVGLTCLVTVRLWHSRCGGNSA